jgi:ribonuclease P protein component
MEDFRLRKIERLTKGPEFQTLTKYGARYRTQNFAVIIYHRDLQDLRRLGIAVNRKVGGAVKRNRVKRLVREFFRLHKEQLPESSDILFVARPGSVTLNYATLCEELLGLFQRLSTP